MNIVFDFGGVIFRWEPDLIVRDVDADDETRAQLLDSIFRHPEWLNYDRGTITLDKIIECTAHRSGLSAQLIAQVIQRMPVLMTPLIETIDLVRRLKTNGHFVFVLSNMPAPSMAYFEKNYDFLEVFDGMVISSRVHMIKPEAQIYQLLLDTYDLRPEETLFIDDVDANLDGAEKLGIGTMKFFNPGQCEGELLKMGLL